MNRDDVIDVLTAVSAADRRTIGKADVDVWQAIIGDLHRDLALQAVRGHLRDEPDVWMQPGHVYKRARALHRDMLDRESDEHRIARQTSQESMAADMRRISECVSGGPSRRKPAYATPRYKAARAVMDNFPRGPGRDNPNGGTPEHIAAFMSGLAELAAAAKVAA
jgi:hypothetical protein